MNIPPEYLNQIVTGDARELAKRIPDESVDLILCDPIYWQIEDYRWLAELAERVLRRGGNIIAQTCSAYRFEAELSMRQSLLVPRPLLAEIYPRACAQMFKDKALIGWKPYLWFSKGERIGEWVFDRVNGGGINKDTHEWGDSESFFVNYIGRLTARGDMVLDPFTGGGTVPAVCKALGRNYVAFEIDAATAERASERVAHTQMPLFVAQPEQLEFVAAPPSP